MNRLFSRVTAFLMIMLGATSLLAQAKGEASADEYRVYEAVLALMDHIPRQEPHITIFGITLNGKCGEEASPTPLANGCSFLWIKPDTAKTIKGLLRTEWPDIETSTWADFEGKTTASVRLHEPISTPWKHKLVSPGDDASKDWDSPDMTIFLSRVGFNDKKTEAIVYVLIFSYMNEVRTAGDYFRFRREKMGGWEPNGRLNYFAIPQDQPQAPSESLATGDTLLPKER